MKHKHMKARTLSLLLVFSMVIGLFSGLTVEKKEASAASQGKIVLGTPSAPVTDPTTKEKYYTFDKVTVDYTDNQAVFQYLTITVDSGYFQVASDASPGILSQGLGLVYGSTMDQNFEEELQPSKKYEAAYFSLIDPQPDKDGLLEFLKAIHFTTDPDPKKEQVVSITATTVGDQVPEKLELEGLPSGQSAPDLKFFDGHYYAFVPFRSDDRSWAEAYRESKTIELKNNSGIYGYLATVTSKAEDRFIVNEFSSGNAPSMGWIGCTRAKLAAGSSYSDSVTKWKQLDRFDSNTCKDNFVWRWVSGPESQEADNRFGYQNHAFGDGHNYWPHDGGFVVDEGKFQNWESTNNNIEPNGGGYTDEAYGYYGRYSSGRWNDAKNVGGYEYGIFGYYIEFGGYSSDDENFEKLGQTTLVGSSDDAKNITNATPAPAVPIAGKPDIKNQNTDKNGNAINEVGTVLMADIMPDSANNKPGVTPEDSHNTLTYQWYIQNGDGSKTPIDGATNQNLTLTDATLNKKLVVEVTADGEKYTGSLTSDPYDTTVTTKAEKIPIDGLLMIINETTDDDGKAINKEGSVYTADLKNVTPVGCHDHLTYQWYYADYYDYPVVDGKTVPTPHLVPIAGATDKSYIMTSDVLNKMVQVSTDENGNPLMDDDGNPLTVPKVHLYVKANAKTDSNYTGEVDSRPYDATRTNSGVTVGSDSDIPSSIKDKLQPGERVIIINPTQVKTIYGVKDEKGNLINDDLIANHKVWHGNNGEEEFTDQADYTGFDGYFEPDPNDTLYVIVDADKNYIIHEVKRPDTTQESNTEVISAEIPDSSITTVPDNKNTENPADDTISIVIDPAKTDYKYGILQKVDGKYVPVSVKKDANGNYIPDPNGTKTWSEGSETKVVFSELPASGTYKIVAVSTSDAINNLINDLNQPLTPDQITGGSKDIQVTVPPYNPFTQEELDAAAEFVKEHATGPDGKVVTEITDITRDIITSGETKWNNMTDNEKAAVNEKLKELGCPYTYEELLKMAKDYKIPGFKLKKVLRKKSKAKLKMVKCKGATIVCTSTNKKVATVNKKGVISAKKVGKATLTITATKGKYTNRVVMNIVVKKKFKNAKELKKFKSSKIKTPTILVARQRKLKQSQKLSVYDLEKGSKVKYKVLINKKVIKMTKAGKYTGRKKGSTLVRATVKQNKKTYILYAYVTIHK